MLIDKFEKQKVFKIARYKCLRSFLFHTKYTFKHMHKRKFVVSEHHVLIATALEMVLEGKITRLMINIAPRYGKAIDVDTPMLTPSGWVRAGDIKPGMYLMGRDGSPTLVQAVYPQGVTDAYCVTMSDNSKIVCCSEHLWEVKNRDRKSSEVLKTKDLIGNLYATDGRKRWEIPVTEPLIGSMQQLPIEPYLLGAWLGNGSSYKAEICGMDYEVIREFEHYGLSIRKHQNAGRAIEYGIRGGFVTKLKQLNLINNKHIPISYINATYADRLALLQGLCDTDGTCGKNGQISFSSSRPILTEGVKSLICSLGGVYTEYIKPGTTASILSFKIPKDCPFRLKRKADRCHQISPKYRARRFIKDISRVTDRETICFTVAAKDHLFLAGKDLVVTHNTELAVKNFMAHGLALNPAAKFIHLSYSDSLALDNSEEVRDIVKSEEYQQLFGYVKIKKSTDSKKKWYTEDNGGVYATSTAGQVTGFGAGRVDDEDEYNEQEATKKQQEEDEELDRMLQDLVDSAPGVSRNPILDKQRFGGAIIIDDPIKPEDGDSDMRRERINARYDSTIRNRVNSRKTPVIIIMQRVHERDLCGYLLEKEPGQWTVLSLPCIKEDGTALWPFKHTLEELYALEALDAVMFSRQYMQRPKPKEGLLFAEEDLTYYDCDSYSPAKDAEYRFGVIDPAETGGDDLSFPWGWLVGDKFYLSPDILYNKHGTDVNEEMAVDIFVNNKLDAGEIEINGGWAHFGSTIRKRVIEKHEECTIRLVKAVANKHTRILAEEMWIKNHVRFPRGQAVTANKQYRSFFENLTSYLRKQEGTSRNKHDDAPDSVARLASYMKRNFSHLY